MTINQIIFLWKTELNYKHLKSHLKIECITSSKKTLIKQDFYSQVLVANMLQAFINDSDEKLQNYNYKNRMKTNDNMVTEIFKNTLLYILLEENAKKGQHDEKIQISFFYSPFYHHKTILFYKK